VSEVFSITVSNLNAVIAGLDKQETKIVLAGAYAIAQVGLAIERETKMTLNNNPHSKRGNSWIPGGHTGGPGSPPNRRTGNLMSSVRTEIRKGLGSYEATVFPTMVYARRLELGLNYPYLRPSVDRVRPRAERIFMTNFMKKWR
jgi:hypothetical protein